MGKPRKSRKDLPRRMYEKHGGFYFVGKDNKWVFLGREFHDAIVKYASIVQPQHGKMRLSGIMDAYIAEKIPKLGQRTQEDYLDALKRLRPIFGDVWPEDIEPKHIYKYLRERGAPTRANREIAVFSNVMQQAIEMGLINANPCKQVRRNKETPRTRDVSDDEVAGFLANTPEWLDVYISLKGLIGLRQGDMLKLTLFNIRDDGLFVEPAKTEKYGKKMLFQWTPTLRTVMEMAKSLRRKQSDARLFQISQRGFKSAWARSMAKYTGEKFAENDLRAKVASNAIDLGMDAASMLGHSSDSVTRRHYIRGTRKVSPLK